MAAGPASADPIGKGVVMYMQMGGNPGDGATLARQTAPRRPRKRSASSLKAQFSAWAPETMIAQFKEAMAAKPDCIEIMGHPGAVAFHDLVKQAVDEGIVVTSGNAPLTPLMNEFGPKGFGYAGVDLAVGGALTANAMLAQGLKAGDEAVVWGIFSQAERGVRRSASPTRWRRPASRSTGSTSRKTSTATPRSAFRSSPPIFSRIRI